VDVLDTDTMTWTKALASLTLFYSRILWTWSNGNGFYF
jgi:hypothetical protein